MRQGIPNTEIAEKTGIKYFCTDLYKYGYEDGRESVPGVELEEVMAAVANARGVGKRTLDNIRDRVEQLFRKEGANE